MPPGTVITVTPSSAIGLNASGASGQITANGITENLAAATTTGALAQTGASITFNGSTLQTTSTTTANSATQTGLRATTGGTISAAGSSLTLGPPNGTTAASNMTGATAEAGSRLFLFDTPITMLGGVAGLNNIGLLATGAGSQISYSGGTIATRSRASFGVEAINGGQVTLDGGAQVVTTGAGVFNSIAGSHALFATGVNSQITGTGVGLNVSGLLASGARAENGGVISLTGGTINSTSAASTDLDPASGARALSGGSIMLDGVTINSSGSRGGGFAVQDAGSQATVTNSTIAVTGPRSYAGLVFNGGQATVTNSSLLVDTATGNFPVVLVQDAGSTITLNNTILHNIGPVAFGLRVTTGGAATMTGGSSTTDGRDAPAIAVSNGTVLATNVALRTNGSDNAMGALADLNGQVTLIGGSVLTTGDAVRISSFPHALGARNPGGVLTAIGTSVETRGNTAMGAVADDGGTMILSGNTIRTLGPSSFGLFSVTEQVGAQFPANLTGSNITVETFGVSAHGAVAQARNDVPVELAMLTLNNSAITTHGDRAVGLRAVLADYGSAPAGRGEAAIVANDTTVLTQGVGAHGALSRDNPTSVTLNQSSVLATGALAQGSVAEVGGRIVGINSSVAATGSLGAALYVTGFPGAVSSGTFTNSMLTNVSGPTIGVGGSGDVTLTNSFAGGSGQWFRVGTAVDFPALLAELPKFGIPDPDAPDTPPVGGPPPPPLVAPITPGLANVTLSNSHVVGSAFTAPGSVSNVMLLNNSIWTMTGSSNLTNLTNDPSLIDFQPPTGDPLLLSSYMTLTVVNYIGAGGIIRLNTYLGNDSSPSDRLIIDGGNASGFSPLRITNTTGQGALTTGNGILVVDAINGGTTNPGTFALAGPVSAGPYDYTLHRSSVDTSNQQAWYLRSTLDCALDPTNPVCQQPGPGPEPPNFRPETSLYAAIPSMTLLYGRTLLDTLHERVGDEEDLRNRQRINGVASGAWGRVIGQHGNHDGDRLGVFGDGPKFNYDIGAFQGGQDFLRRDGADGSRDHAGVYAAIGALKGDVTHFDRRQAGTDSFNAYSLGGYWTHFGAPGWYLDTIVQGTWYDVKGISNRFPVLTTNGWGFAASLEAGYPIKLGGGFIVEPQAQFVYQNVGLDDARDTAATVQFRNIDSIAARIGARFARTWLLDKDPQPRSMTAWVRPSVWNEFRGNPQTLFSSADGPVPFHSNLGRTWIEANAGMNAEITRATSLFANVGYLISTNGISTAYNGKIGLRAVW